MAPLALVANFATCILIPNLTTRWRQLHKFHIWPPKLSTRLSHLHCQIALDCPIALLPYCPIALLPYCSIALLLYCSIALLPYCPIALLPWYLYQPELHQLNFNTCQKGKLERTGPIDRTPGTPGSDKNYWYITFALTFMHTSIKSWQTSTLVFLINLKSELRQRDSISVQIGPT